MTQIFKTGDIVQSKKTKDKFRVIDIGIIYDVIDMVGHEQQIVKLDTPEWTAPFNQWYYAEDYTKFEPDIEDRLQKLEEAVFNGKY